MASYRNSCLCWKSGTWKKYALRSQRFYGALRLPGQGDKGITFFFFLETTEVFGQVENSPEPPIRLFFLLKRIDNHYKKYFLYYTNAFSCYSL